MPSFRLTILFAVATCWLLHRPAAAQETVKLSLRDTLDGKLDFSSVLIDAHGFLPVPVIITEPALGGIGGGLVPMFIHPAEKKEDHPGYVPPDITAAAGMYTANHSWAVGAFRMGMLQSVGIRYKVMAMYGDINLDFYRNINGGDEKRFEFGMQTAAIHLSAGKKITRKNHYLGLQYTFITTELTPAFTSDQLTYFENTSLHSNTGDLGIFAEWDKRNTIFTPDKGFIVHLNFVADDSWTGSDYTYQKMWQRFNWFLPVSERWVSAIRVESHQSFGKIPFYLEPGIELRGVPLARYQGKTTLVAETEQRFDFNLRWSMVAFGGWGTALQDQESLGEDINVYNFGSGFRYLLARAFKLRAGIDVAKGPDAFAWYVVFGHNWNR